MYEAFGYKWIQKSTNKYYYGIHKGSPNDNYAGSGTVFRKLYGGKSKNECKNPEDWVRIIEIKGTHDECIKWETDLVNDDLLKDPLCINIVCGGGSGYISREFYDSISGDNHYMRKWSKEKVLAHVQKGTAKRSATMKRIANTPERLKLASETFKKAAAEGKTYKAKKGIDNLDATKYKMIDTKGNETIYSLAKDVPLANSTMSYIINNNNGLIKKGKLKGYRLVKLGKWRDKKHESKTKSN